jgi:putative transposase
MRGLVVPRFSSSGASSQSRNLMIDGCARERPMRFLIHDRGAKFSAAFDDVFRAEGIEVIRTPFRAPNANAHASASCAPCARSAWTGC